MNPVSVDGYHIRESGATAAQEMAYAILIANAYIDNVLKRGCGIDIDPVSMSYPLFRTLSM